jgi:hypothetical protein
MTVPAAPACISVVPVPDAGEALFPALVMGIKISEAVLAVSYTGKHQRAFVSGRMVGSSRALADQRHRAEPRGGQKADKSLTSTGADGS